MGNDKLKKLPNGKWAYLVDENGDMIVADTQEEAERLAKAYINGDKSVVKKRVARQDADKARKSVIGDD